MSKVKTPIADSKTETPNIGLEFEWVIRSIAFTKASPQKIRIDWLLIHRDANFETEISGEVKLVQKPKKSVTFLKERHISDWIAIVQLKLGGETIASIKADLVEALDEKKNPPVIFTPFNT